jgi:hypothetical protein
MATFEDVYKQFQEQAGGYIGIDNNGYKSYCGINKKYSESWAGWTDVTEWVKTLGGDDKAKDQKSSDNKLIKMVREWFDENCYKKYKLNEITDISIVGQLFETAASEGLPDICKAAFGTTDMNEIVKLSNKTPDYYIGKIIDARSKYYHSIVNSAGYKKDYADQMDKRIADMARITGANGYVNTSNYGGNNDLKQNSSILPLRNYFLTHHVSDSVKNKLINDLMSPHMAIVLANAKATNDTTTNTSNV